MGTPRASTGRFAMSVTAGRDATYTGSMPAMRPRATTVLCAGLAILASVPTVALGRPLPRNRPLSPETQHAISRAVAMEARGPEAWAALEARFESGTITAVELDELRIHWAATVDERHARSRWSLVLMEAGVDPRTAVLTPQAVEKGDLAALEAVLDAAPNLPVELKLVHVAAMWGQGKEGKAALVYREVLGNDSLLAYYDTLMEEWLRGRAAEMVAGNGTGFEPSQPDLTEALRQNLRARGPAGSFLLSVLEPAEPPEALGVPQAEIRGELVDEVIGSQRLDLYYCYERTGGIDRLGVGALTMEFGVGPYGAVEFCSVLPSADLRTTEFRDCCCGAVESLRFPAPEGGGRATVRQTVRFPMKKK